MEHINEYVNTKLYDELCEKEKDHEKKLEDDLDYAADQIDDGVEPADVYDFFLKEHKMDEKEFKAEMLSRGINLRGVDLEKYEEVEETVAIPIKYIREYIDDEPNWYIRHALEVLIDKYKKGDFEKDE